MAENGINSRELNNNLTTVIMNYGLSEDQQKAFDFLVEFYEPNRNRCTGRSYLMAAVIIQTAINNPGMEVNIIDHSDIYMSDPCQSQCYKKLIGTINHLLSVELPDDIADGMEISFVRRTVKYIPTAYNKRVTNQKDLLDQLTKWPEVK